MWRKDSGSSEEGACSSEPVEGKLTTYEEGESSRRLRPRSWKSGGGREGRDEYCNSSLSSAGRGKHTLSRVRRKKEKKGKDFPSHQYKREVPGKNPWLSSSHARKRGGDRIDLVINLKAPCRNEGGISMGRGERKESHTLTSNIRPRAEEGGGKKSLSPNTNGRYEKKGKRKGDVTISTSVMRRGEAP